MLIVLFLAPCALLLGLGFFCGFYWAARDGQFDDLETPAFRILLEETTDAGHQRQPRA